eukprot:2626575-Amphidinium_carterae.1
MGFHPHDLDANRKRKQGPTFEIPVPSLRLPSSSSKSMKASNHTLAITNKPHRLALFKRPGGNQKLCPIDCLLQPRQGNQTLSLMSV